MRARRELDREIVAAGRALVARRLTHGTSGNVSARVAGGLRITPTRRRFESLGPGDLVTTDLEGRVRAGRHRPSVELPLHALLYRLRPDVMAVVHTHSPYATTMSLGDGLPDLALEEQAYYRTGTVAVAAHAPSGSRELAANVAETLGASAAVLLERHGVVAVGASLDEAVAIAESVEHQAQVGWLALTARLGIGLV